MRTLRVSIPRSEFGWFRLGESQLLHGFSSVSIPRSEFGWFRLLKAIRVLLANKVSIPQSEFGWFRPSSAVQESRKMLWFQFLSRNSVGSDGAILEDWHGYERVSIPQSEFGWFRPVEVAPSSIPKRCFNSSVGIRLVQTLDSRIQTLTRELFQFLRRNSVGSDNGSCVADLIESRFNSSVGIRLVQTGCAAR